MKHVRDVIKIGAPLLAGALVEYIMYIADSVMVGRLGTEHLAAVAVGGMAAEILWAFTWTVAPAVQTFVSRRYGAQTAGGSADRRPAATAHTGEAVQTGMVFGITAGAAALAASVLARPVLAALIESPATVDLAMEYVRVVRWSMVPAAVFFGMYGFLSGIGRTRTLMIATVLTNVLNIALNYLLIYGKASFPALGIRGAALGTFLAQGAGLLFITTIIFSRKDLRAYRIFHIFSRKSSGARTGLLAGIFKAWLPVTLQNIGAFCIFLVYEGLVSRFGTVHLGVIHIVFLLTWAGKSISGGFSQGGSILVGNSLGRGDKVEARQYARACLFIGVITGFLLAAASLLFPDLLLRAFNPDAETLVQGRQALRFFALFMFAGTAGYALETVFTFNGWGSYVLTVDLISHSLFTLGFSWAAVLLFHAGIRTVWTGYGIYLAVFTALLAAGFFSMKWANRKVS